MNQIDIKGIRARADKAAPGPWEVVYHNEDYGQGYGETTFFVKMNDCLIKIGVASNPKSYELYDTLAKGIVLDHQDVPALLDEIGTISEQFADVYAENQLMTAKIARLEGLVDMLLDDLTLLPATASRDVIVASAAASVATMYKKIVGLKVENAGNGADSAKRRCEWDGGSMSMGRRRKVNRKIGERLRWLRAANGKSQQVVADFVGIHQTTLGEYERGLCMPSPDVLTWLAGYYDVSLDYLLGRTDERKNPNV